MSGASTAVQMVSVRRSDLCKLLPRIKLSAKQKHINFMATVKIYGHRCGMTDRQIYCWCSLSLIYATTVRRDNGRAFLFKKYRCDVHQPFTF